MSTQSNSHEAVSRSGSDLAQPGGTGTGEQAHITCSPLIAKCSLDTLHVSLWVDLSESDILEKIEELRQVARDYELDKVPFTYFSTEFNVWRSGRRHFQYHISTADTHIYFNKRKSDGSFPTCLIEIGSMSSWSPGAFTVYKNILSFFSFASIKVKKHNVSRVDLAADFVGKSFQKIGLQNVKKWVTRANKFACYYSGRTPTGVSVGAGDIMLRVYDKTRELSDKKASSKQEFFEKIWGTKNKPVTRVEFQLRRAFLKDFHFSEKDSFQIGPEECCDVDTVEMLELTQNALWKYCVNHWARHCSEPVDSINRHQDRAKPSSFWFLVQGIKFNENDNQGYRSIKVKKYVNINALVEQATGCMLAAAAACSMVSPDDIHGAIEFCTNKISESLFLQYVDKTAEFIRKAKTNMALNNMQFQS